MDVLRNSVTHHSVKSKFENRLRIKSVTLSVTPAVPYRPTRGAVAVRPTFQITYPLTDRPDGPPLARDRFPPQGISLGRLSLAQGRPRRDRPRSHGRARANVPWDVGTHMGKRRLGRRAHAFTRCLCGPRGPLDGRASGQRAYAAACRSSPSPRAARARSSSCSRPSRCMAATGPAATASIVGLVASSPARTTAAFPPLLFAATT